MQQNLGFNLEDLEPQEMTFNLSTLKDDKGQPINLTLIKWSLRVRKWAVAKFGGPEKLQEMFQLKNIDAIAEMAWYMLKEKDIFKATGELSQQDVFLDSISSMKDQLNLINALLGTIGIGEPEREKIVEIQTAAKNDPNGQSPKTT